MKTIILIIVFLFSIPTFSQQKIGEKQAIQKSHIDFAKEYLFFTIHGLIEIDGHTFLNDTCKNPLIFQANLEDVSIYRKNNPEILYTHRVCEIKNCPILHFVVREEKTPETMRSIWERTRPPNFYLNNKLETEPLDMKILPQ